MLCGRTTKGRQEAQAFLRSIKDKRTRRRLLPGNRILYAENVDDWRSYHQKSMKLAAGLWAEITSY